MTTLRLQSRLTRGSRRLLGLATPAIALATLWAASPASATVTATFYPQRFDEMRGYLELRSDEASDTIDVNCVDGGPAVPDDPDTPYRNYVLKVNGADPAGGPAYCRAYVGEPNTRHVGAVDARLGAGADALTLPNNMYFILPALVSPSRLVVDGGAGADYLETHGESLYLGGPGDDFIAPAAGAAEPGPGTFFLGEDGDDTIVGGAQISGGPGDDSLWGRGGDDLIDAFGEGSDEGNDKIYGGHGGDTIVGGLGQDTVSGGEEGDRIFLGPDTDFAHGRSGRDRIFGGTEADRLSGDFGADLLRGGDADDVLRGGPGGDRLFGGTGSDRLMGEDRNDCLFGNAGRDFLFGGPDEDFLRGGRGADVERGGPGSPAASCFITPLT